MRAVLPLFLILCCSLQTHAQTSTDGAGSSDRKSVDAEWPVADYSNPDFSARGKSPRHTGKDWVKEKAPSVVGESILFSEVDVPAIPVEMSDVIFVGKVVSLRAMVSADKSDVYTQIEILGSDFLKGSGTANLTIERRGGIVRYPGGKQVRYRVAGERLPRVGCTYLFFAKAVDHNLELITAYMLNSQVRPLDGHQNSRFAEFNGTSSPMFLELVRRKVKETER